MQEKASDGSVVGLVAAEPLRCAAEHAPDVQPWKQEVRPDTISRAHVACRRQEVLSNQAAARPPVGERAEIETQHAGLSPRSLEDHGIVRMRPSSTQRIDDRIDSRLTKPVPRECE